MFILSAWVVYGMSAPGASRAATANVAVGASGGGLVFVPATTNINTGDTVLWTWVGSFHSTTGDTSIWDSGVHNAGNTFSRVFSSSGSFPYHCSIHGSPGVGMAGSIIVAAPNSPPNVSITSPAAGTVFSAPANVTIKASASDSDGTVTNLQFLVGATVLTNETAGPFSVMASNLAAGIYNVSGVATDNSGAKATNSVAISVVTPLSITLTNLLRFGTNFQFTYTGNIGLTYVVQVATNPTAPNWIGIATNTAAVSPVTFIDTNAAHNPAIYRVGRLPNP